MVLQMQASGIPHLPQLLAYFSTLEAANFEIFTSCNQANDQITVLQREVRAAESEVRQLEQEGVLGKQKDVIRQTLAKRDQIAR